MVSLNLCIVAFTVILCSDFAFNFIVPKYTDTTLINDAESEAFLDSFELLTKYGYAPERHDVTTDNGNVIGIFRIPRKGPPVILVHGIGDSSDEWILLGPERSLGYQLADSGLDVWLFNTRGNRYSKSHRANISQEKYWNFSFEDIGTQDLPATIDYVLQTTSREKISYIGFSQGTTIFIVMCSMRPEYNQKIELSILLAPVAWVGHIISPLASLPVSKLLSGLYEIFPYNPGKVYERIRCYRRYPSTLCNLEFHLNFGLVNSSHLSPDKILIIDSHLPAGISAKNLVHFVQCHKSKRFQRFDYGSRNNMKMYSSIRPPLYDVKLVTAPVYIFSSEIDWFSPPNDVQILRNKLPNIKRFVMFNKSLQMSHLEFVYGTHVNSFINNPVLDILHKDLNISVV